MLAVGACSGVEELGPAPSPGSEPAPLSRLARLHVIIQPPGEFTSDEPALEITGVFAQYRGFDDPGARARLDLHPLPVDRLRPGMCAPSEQVVALDEAAAKDSPAGRELVLLDAGNVAVRLGEAMIDVPLALLPDLVPTISGVTYIHVADFLPGGAWPTAEPAPTELLVRVDGEGDDLPGFTLRPPVPEALVPTAELSPDGASLHLDWRPEGRGEPVALRFLGQIGGEPVGEEVTCLADDDGGFRVDLDRLHALGLDGSAGNSLRITTTRAARTLFDVGEFTGAEVIVEVRTTLVLGT